MASHLSAVIGSTWILNPWSRWGASSKPCTCLPRGEAAPASSVRDLPVPRRRERLGLGPCRRHTIWFPWSGWKPGVPGTGSPCHRHCCRAPPSSLFPPHLVSAGWCNSGVPRRALHPPGVPGAVGVRERHRDPHRGWLRPVQRHPEGAVPEGGFPIREAGAGLRRGLESEARPPRHPSQVCLAER